MTILSARLKRARTAAGLTPHALERKAQLSAGTVGRLESGERADPRMTTIRALSTTLNIPIAWLFDEDAKPPRWLAGRRK
jgi:transcriptional regulator with XRE-family HTH domain